MRSHALAGAIAVFAVVACGQPTGGGLAADQTLRFAIASDVGMLDPAQLYASADIQVAQNLFAGLVRYDDALHIVPDLATSLPAISADGLTYTFHLRPDAAFANGDRVTSRDVVYSWDRAAATQGPYAGFLSAIAGFDRLSPQAPTPERLVQLLARSDPSVTLTGLSAPDDTTVVVKLARPAGWLLSALALPGAVGAIIDRKAVEASPSGWWSRPETFVGSGPYRLSGRAPGRWLEFQAVSNRTVRTVHVDVVPDAVAREAGYEHGTYDLNGFGGASVLATADVARIRATPELAAQLVSRPGTGSAWASFNLAHDAARSAGGPFLSSLGQSASSLRLALALAIDRKRLAAACGAICVPATGGLIPPGLGGYGGDGSDPLAAFDPARARALLRGADPDGARTRGLAFVYDAESPLYQALAESLRDQWAANLGIHVDVVPEAHQQLLKDARAGRLVLSRAGWQADYDHPQDWYDNLFGRAAGCPDSNCVSGYDSGPFDQLATQAASRPLEAALPLYAQLGRLLSADAAYIPLVYSMRMYMIKPYVRGAGANNLLEHPWSEYELLQH